MNAVNTETVDNWRKGIIARDAHQVREVGRYKITYERRSRQNAMGRFGGGWDWKLGIQASKSEWIISLIVSSLRIWRRPLCADCGSPANSGRGSHVRRGDAWINLCETHREVTP